MLRAGVIGDPVSHSLSPALHGYWLEALGIAGSYEAIPVDSVDLADFVKGLPDRYVGVNVTLPHKEAVMSHCDEVSDVARIIGAVNTLWVEDGKIIGDNTDIVGFLAGLGEIPKVAMVLGAGGASRSVVYGLLSRGCGEVRLVNRTQERAESLAEEFSSYGRIEVLSYAEMDSRIGDCGLVVNCSSAGVRGEDVILPNFSAMAEGSVAYDISYKPYETAFLREAKNAGLSLCYGIDMLIHQAVPGFCRWFSPKSKPVVDSALRNYLVDLLKPKNVFVLGLTGSIGMGKSTVAEMFSDFGAVVIDSDSIVHELLGFGGGAVDKALKLYPEAKITNSDGLIGVDRAVLSKSTLESSDIEKLESVLHPLIAERRGKILDDLKKSRDEFCLVVLDVPLLFEKGIDKECDYVVVVSAGEEIQKERVMARKGMTEEKFKSILGKQMPDAEKRKRATLVLDTSLDLDKTKNRVKDVYKTMKIISTPDKIDTSYYYYNKALEAYEVENYKEAVRCWKEAAEQEDEVSQSFLAAMYYQGKGISQNYEEAAKWYLKSAKYGHTLAQEKIGMMYKNGEGVAQNYEEAAKWYLKAAEQGETSAQLQLSLMYFEGLGVPQNYEEMLKWGLKGVRITEEDTQGIFNAMLDNRRDIPQDDAKEIFTLVSGLAKQGDTAAQGFLGAAYYKEIGTSKDIIKAYMWFSIAIANGYDEMEELRQVIEKEMTSAEIGKTQQLAMQCIESNYQNCDGKKNIARNQIITFTIILLLAFWLFS